MNNQLQEPTPNPRPQRKEKKMRTTDKVWCVMFIVTACICMKYFFCVKAAIRD